MANTTTKSKRLGSCWKDLNHENTNGLFETKGKVMPDELMEIVLSYIEPTCILSATQVCRLWKDITTRLPFWKLFYANQGAVEWSEIPQHIKEKPNSWIALYSICANNLLRRNLIPNPSGLAESATPLAGWEIRGNATIGDEIGARVEAHPINGRPLPPDTDFGNNTSCIATTHKHTTVQHIIRLGDVGLSISVMKLLAPFTMEFSAMIGVRTEYGGAGSLQIEGHDDTVSLLFEILRIKGYPANSQWQKVDLSVYFPRVDGDDDLLDHTHSLHFIINTFGRRDEYTEGGFYGTKFSRCSARLKLIHDPAKYTTPEHDNNPHSYTYDEKILKERYVLDSDFTAEDYHDDCDD